MVNNEPLIDLGNHVLLELLSLDPSLKEISSCSGSDGSYSFNLESSTLNKNYPELFYLSFNSTSIERRGDKFIVAQYFKIGHSSTEFPERVPDFVNISSPEKIYVSGLGDITREVKGLGWKERNVDNAKKRGILRIGDIKDISGNIYKKIFPDVIETNIDFSKNLKELIKHCENENLLYPGESPEQYILRKHIKQEIDYSLFSHLTSENKHHKNYFGSLLITPCKKGELNDSIILENFRKFYSVLHQVLIEQNLPDPLKTDY